MSNEQAFRPSPQQERLWLTADGPARTTQVTLAVEGAADAGALQRALAQVVERHEILRTTFARRPGIRFPLQVVHDDLVLRFGADAGDAPDPLAGEPLLRAVVTPQGDGRWTLVLTAPALVLDAASAPALAAELAAALGASEVPEEPLQYADYAEWQHELATSEDDDPKAGRRHWADLDGVRSPALPVGPAAAGATAGTAEVPDAAELAAAAVATAERYGTTPEAVAHAAWHALLARLTGAEQIATALLDGGPGRDPLDGLIGPAARPVPVVTPVIAQTTFAELVTRVDRAREAARRWEDYAPAGAADGLAVGFASTAGFQAAGGGVTVSVTTVDADPGAGVWLDCHDLAGSARLRVRHGAESDGEAVDRLAGAFGRLLRSAAADPSRPVAELELLSDADRRRLLVDFNVTAVEGTPASLPERFAAHAQARPDAVAVQDAETALTFAELTARAAGLAEALRAQGVAAGDVVALCTDRSADMVAGLLGILQTGAAFLPLHHEHPGPRLRAQLEDAGCRVLVTQPALRSCVPADGLTVLELDGIAVADGPVPAAAPAPGDLAYVIYTSGSTGRPKGVGVTHGNLANYVDHLVRHLDAEAAPLTFGVVTALSTDLGHTSVFGALGSGGTLALIAPAEAADGAAFARRLERTPVDVLKITPSHLAALLAGGDARVLPRRWLLLGGERLGWDLVERVRALGGCTIVNHYGPTETTVGSCMLTVGDGPGPFAPASVPIGRPIANTRCYLLDARREPVPVGAPGALFIAGAGVASGYVGRPDLTAERFVADPFVDGGAAMYDTGDLARWLPDGTLEYLGRADEQVKIRGYRVEPGEVEEALRAHDAVREAAVVVHADGAGEPRLIAYVAGDAGREALAGHLAGLVPEYMVPAAFVEVDALPRTPSGKVDRRALPDPPEPGAEAEGHVAPRTPLEQAVAAIWSQVLGLEQVGVEDDFFALGGHSLLAAQVVAQVRSDFAVELPMHSLFTTPTVAGLADEIGRLTLEDLSSEELEQMLAESSTPADEV